jgi:hypothetical protein
MGFDTVRRGVEARKAVARRLVTAVHQEANQFTLLV